MHASSAGIQGQRRRSSAHGDNRRRSTIAPDVEGMWKKKTFPMWVLPVSELLKLDRIKSHEELMADKLLVEVTGDEFKDSVIFFSHTWLGHTTPDPDNKKLDLAKHILKHAQRGELPVQPFWYTRATFGRLAQRVPAKVMQLIEYVWMDFWSIPQADKSRQADAISSIPEYISHAAQFMVLAPPANHENGDLRDARGWGNRGWCRMEGFCNAVKGDKPIIVAQSPSDIVSHLAVGTMTQNLFFQSKVGFGHFTVESDRAALGPVIAKVVRAHKNTAKRTGDMFTYRLLHALEAAFVEGTGHEVPLDADLDAWLKAMEFASVNEGLKSGWTPLMFAIYAERPDLVSELLKRGASTKTRVPHGEPRVGAVAGFSPLHAACGHQGNPEIVQLLLQHGANPRAPDFLDSHPLIFACQFNRIANYDVMVAHHPELVRLPAAKGLTFAYVQACSYGQQEMFEHLVKLDPKLIMNHGTGNCGASLMSECLVISYNVDLMRSIADAGIDVDLAAPPTSGKLKAIYRIADFFGWLIKKPDPALDFALHATRCRPIHMSAFYGRVGAVNLIIERGGDMNTTFHPKGMTPLHLAAMMGHAATVEALCLAGALLKRLDKKGRTPSQLAATRGHHHICEMLDAFLSA